MNLIRSAAAAAALLLAACQQSETNTVAPEGAGPPEAQIAPILETPEAKDAATYARPLEARVYHARARLRHDPRISLRQAAVLRASEPDGPRPQRQENGKLAVT